MPVIPAVPAVAPAVPVVAPAVPVVATAAEQATLGVPPAAVAPEAVAGALLPATTQAPTPAMPVLAPAVSLVAPVVPVVAPAVPVVGASAVQAPPQPEALAVGAGQPPAQPAAQLRPSFTKDSLDEAMVLDAEDDDDAEDGKGAITAFCAPTCQPTVWFCSSYTHTHCRTAGQCFAHQHAASLQFIAACVPGLGGAKNPGRAKYMRFWRSITCNTKKTPPALLAHVKQLRQEKEKEKDGNKEKKRGFLAFLIEDLWLLRAVLPTSVRSERRCHTWKDESQTASAEPMTCNIAVHTCQDWAQSGGDWGKSAIYQNLTRTEKQRRRGRFKKMTRDQLLAKYADTELVAQLISRKESEHLAFDHPDFPGRGWFPNMCRSSVRATISTMCQHIFCHWCMLHLWGNPSMRLYKCWDSEEYEDEEESVASMTLGLEVRFAMLSMT
jgi:hypothetical protein